MSLSLHLSTKEAVTEEEHMSKASVMSICSPYNERLTTDILVLGFRVTQEVL